MAIAFWLAIMEKVSRTLRERSRATRIDLEWCYRSSHVENLTLEGKLQKSSCTDSPTYSSPLRLQSAASAQMVIATMFAFGGTWGRGKHLDDLG